MTISKLETKINNLKKRGVKVQEDIHNLAIECLEHAQENKGDFTMLTKLYHALPLIVRRGTFIQWSKEFSPCRFTVKKTKGQASIKVFKKSKAPDAPVFDINGARKTPIHTFEPVKGTDELNPLTCDELEKRVLKYITKLEKEAKKAGNKEGLVYLNNLHNKVA